MTSSDFVKSLFVGPKEPKPMQAPAVDDKAIQDQTALARRRALLAKGRKSTILAGLNEGLGSIGS